MCLGDLQPLCLRQLLLPFVKCPESIGLEFQRGGAFKVSVFARLVPFGGPSGQLPSPTPTRGDDF